MNDDDFKTAALYGQAQARLDEIEKPSNPLVDPKLERLLAFVSQDLKGDVAPVLKFTSLMLNQLADMMPAHTGRLEILAMAEKMKLMLMSDGLMELYDNLDIAIATTQDPDIYSPFVLCLRAVESKA